MRAHWAIVLCLMAFGAGSALAGDDIDDVVVRTWISQADGSLALPELDDVALAVPELAERPSFGIAFSGGGTRSASASLGALRALHQLGWLNRARYLSANSGGSWLTVPFTYLPLTIDDRRFLDEYIPPERLSEETLRPATTDPLSFATAIHDASTFDEVFELGRGDEAYSDIVASIFLQPFGLHDNEKFFTFNRDALNTVLAANPNLGAENFQVVERDDRPYLIVTGVMLAQQMSEDPDEYFPLEMTPLYTGIRGRFEFEKDDEVVVVGGGYVESFGYDSYEPEARTGDNRWRVRLKGSLLRGDKPFGDRYRFTLSDVIGTSSAAPLATLSRNNIPNMLFPEFRHWPVDQEAIHRSDQRVRRKADEFQHGDGADMDNLSITSLLARKTENIIAFVNTSTAFQSAPSSCMSVNDEQITDDVISLFRQNGRLVHNVVFGNGTDELTTLCESFARKKSAGEPLVHCQPYDVIQNDWYRIEPYTSNVCWVYLDRVANWMERLDPTAGDIVSELLNSEGSFDNFPHYSTFAEHGIALIDLNRERVIALSNLSAWVVMQSAAYIAEHLAGVELAVPTNE